MKRKKYVTTPGSIHKENIIFIDFCITNVKVFIIYKTIIDRIEDGNRFKTVARYYNILLSIIGIVARYK